MPQTKSMGSPVPANTAGREPCTPHAAEAAPPFPMGMPGGAAPRQTLPGDVVVLVKEVTERGARLLLRPAAAAVESILDETYGPMGWCCRRYSCGGTLYCSVGVYNPAAGDYLHKDAPATGDYTGRDKARAAAVSCFAAAAAHWGVCADLAALPAIDLDERQVEIVPVAGRDARPLPATGWPSA